MKFSRLIGALTIVSLCASPLHAQARYRAAASTDTQKTDRSKPSSSGRAGDLRPEIRTGTHASPLIFLGIGAIGLAAALGSSGGGGESSPPAPVFPEEPHTGPGGSVDDFLTSEYFASGGLAQTEAAYRYAQGAYGLGTLVSVYDTGVDATHPDLTGQIDPTYSHSYFSGTDDVADVIGHGTHVAGIIAAEQNGQGVEGIAWGARLMISKGVGGPVAADSFADAIYRSLDAGAVSMNNSWTYTGSDGKTITIDQVSSADQARREVGTDTIRALSQAAGAGMVSVFAAGNDGAAEPSIMAGLPLYFGDLQDSILGVVALDGTHRIASFSNRCGSAMNSCLAAPGVDIVSTYPKDLGADYVAMSGTSMAAPFVTGAIAVLKSEFPELTGSQIVDILRTSATDLGAPGVDEIYGWGELNLRAAQAPAGTLKIETSASTEGASVTLANSAIIASPGVASVLRASLADKMMIVTDDYDRGYHVPVSAFISPLRDAHSAHNAAQAFTSDTTSQISISTQDGTFSISQGNGSAIAGAGWVDASAVNAPYLALLNAPTALQYEMGAGGAVQARFAHASANSHALDASYLRASLAGSLGFARGVLSVGALNEAGGFLGTSAGSAFGSGMTSHTRFVELGLELDLDASTRLNIVAAQGYSSFDGAGLLRTGDNLRSRAFAVGMSMTDLFHADGTTSIALISPVSLNSGKMTLALPVAMGASTGAQRATEVQVASSTVDIKGATARPDLQLGYSRRAGPGNLRAGLVLAAGTLDHAGVSLGWKAEF